MTDKFNVDIKFPEGMSQRDKQIILTMANEHFKGRDFATQEDAQIALQAWLGENLPYQTRKIN